MLYFAYGSNMSRAGMARRCRNATAPCLASLAGWRFIVMRSGYASVEPCAGGVVHGVAWQMTPRDTAALNAYEDVDGGLYRRVWLPIRIGGALRTAMVYVGCDPRYGAPKPGYLHGVIVPAAREWELPEPYIGELAGWGPRFAAPPPREPQDMRCPIDAPSAS